MKGPVSFGDPWWFAAFALLPLLVILFWRGEALRRRALQALVAPRLQPELAGKASPFRRRLSFLLVLAGLAGVFLALTRPRYGEAEETRTSVGRDILIAMDTSRSMLANDIPPTRLGRARMATEDLLGKLHGDRVGVIAFAGGAFLQAPLTVDYPAVRSSLQALDTTTIPVGGTNIAAAIRCAADAFGKGESDQRALIIFTDGEELDEDGLKAAREAASAMRIFTVGMGSPEGTVISLPGARGSGTEYVKSPEGQIVKSALDEPRLRAIAEAGGGFYLRLQNGPAEMDAILRGGLEAMSRHQAETTVTRRPLERYRWPLAAGLLCLAASMLPGERRRGSAVAAMLLLWAVSAQAANPGLEAYAGKDFKGALGSFEKQLEQRPGYAPLEFDSGAAAHEAGDLDKALDYFSRALTTRDPALKRRAQYNLGNTLLERAAAQKDRPPKVQDLKNAVQHYDEVLRTVPADADATFNRDLARQLLVEEEQKQKQEEEKKQQQQQQKKKQQQQKQSGEDQQKQSGGEKKDDAQDQDGQGEPKEGDSGESGQEQQAQGKQGKTKEDHEQASAENQQSARNLNGQLADAPKTGPEQGRAPGEEGEKSEEQRAQEDAAAAEAGQMTPTQANALLESLKSADDRVSLLNPAGEKRKERTVRDW